MIKTAFAPLVALVLVATPAWSAPASKKPAPAGKPTTYKLDPGASSLTWRASKVTGKHDGEIKLKSGEIQVSGDAIKGGEFVIDMTTIADRDIQDAEYKKKLETHLRSDDFFSIEKHPTATFKVTGVKPIAGAPAGKENFDVTGDLTIKGITHPLTFPAKLTLGKEKAEATGTAKVDRTKYDVRYGSGKFFQGLGDKMIHDDFFIDLKLVGNAS